MPTNWILRIGDGKNFENSSQHNIWGIYSKNKKNFLENVQRGDRLWFVLNKSNGKLFGVATYTTYTYRDEKSLTFEQLGWNGTNWDIDIYYSDLYRLADRNLFTEIKGQVTIRKYNENIHTLDLNEIYNQECNYILQII